MAKGAVNVMGHSGNANLNHREVPPYTANMFTPASVETVRKTVTALVRTGCLHTVVGRKKPEGSQAQQFHAWVPSQGSEKVNPQKQPYGNVLGSIMRQPNSGNISNIYQLLHT